MVLASSRGAPWSPSLGPLVVERIGLDLPDPFLKVWGERLVVSI